MSALEELQLQIDELARQLEELFTRESGTGWIDYSATSTIVGWSSFTEKYLSYKKVGKFAFVTFSLFGTSDSINITFTLPYSLVGSPRINAMIRAMDNSVAGIGLAELSSGSTVTCYWSTSLSAWTASGTKRVAGQFFYVVA